MAQSSDVHMENFQVGIIGMGLMGKMYARRLGNAGWRVNACDLPSKYRDLQSEFADQKNVNILEDGHLVSRRSDYIIYNVEAENIGRVVEAYGRSTKYGAIVGGQTSCKAPEIAAFEKAMNDEFLPDVDIISCHSLHGPGVDPKGQPLVLVQHRDKKGSLTKVENVLRCLESTFVYLTAEKHDRITADTQAATHAAFLSMGAAWAANRQFPWEIGRYLGGIENVKINITLRIYSNKWHIYAGLAILNPSAKEQIKQYAQSVMELLKLMSAGQREELSKRIKTAGAAVFSDTSHELLLQDDVLDRFSLGVPPPKKVRNNHLSLLGMVDCWWKLGIVPYDHMICSTPLFRLWLGAAEYLFRNPSLLEDAIDTAIEDITFRGDDIEFASHAREWSNLVSEGNMDAYRRKFEGIQTYFAPRFPEASKLGNEMIKTILDKTKD